MNVNTFFLVLFTVHWAMALPDHVVCDSGRCVGSANCTGSLNMLNAGVCLDTFWFSGFHGAKQLDDVVFRLIMLVVLGALTGIVIVSIELVVRSLPVPRGYHVVFRYGWFIERLPGYS